MKKFNSKKLKEKFREIKSQLDKDAVIYLILLVALILYGLTKFVFPAFSELAKNIDEYSNTKDLSKAMENRLNVKRNSENKQEIKVPDKLPVKIYKAPYKEMELENAAAIMINKIINIIKNNGTNKIVSLELKKQDLKDSYGVLSKNHSVLSLQVELETSYEIIQTVLNEIYLMDYLVKINKISLNSMKKYNYKRVQAFLVIDIFVKI